MDLPNRWLYIDFNSYFASVEQQINPFVRGKPVAVVPVETDATSAIAASYEAKAFGVKTGTPIYEAKRMCPDLICVLANHEAYVDFHHRLLAEIGKYLPITKVCSIDEVACQLMDNENSFEKATEIAKKIKQGIAKNVGVALTCSIGVAPNRYLAKVATDMKKPDGLVFLNSADLPEKLYSLRLRDLPGIGANMEQRLSSKGIRDMRTLLSLDRERMRKAWGGVWGERMWYYLRGIEVPDPETEKSSISHSHVLSPDLREPEKAYSVARRLTLKAASRLRRMGYVASAISLSVRTEEGTRYEASTKCWQISDSLTFLKRLDELWRYVFSKVSLTRVKKVSIYLSRLQEKALLQPELFSELSAKDLERKAKGEKLSLALDKINHRYGKDSVSLGVLPPKKTDASTKIAFTRIPDKEEFFE